MKTFSRQNLWQRLQSSGLVEGDIPLEEKGESPWYVRVMLGVAGWIGSMFLLSFAGASLAFVMRSAMVALLVGTLVSGGAYAIFKTRHNSDFFTQFGLALGLAGQTLLIYGIFELFNHHESLVCVVIFIAEALLTFLMPNFIYRVLSSLAAALALSFALYSAGAYGLVSGLLAVAFIVIWLQDIRWSRFSEICHPVGYGLAFSMLYCKACILWADWPRWSRSAGPNWMSQTAPWLGKVLILSVFLIVVFILLKRMQIAVSSRSGLAALAATGIGIAVAFSVPGVGQGLLILIIGFSIGNRILIGIGLLASCAFLSNYYYLLQSSLMEKSLLLIGIGAVLLITRVLIRTVLPLSEGGQADA